MKWLTIKSGGLSSGNSKSPDKSGLLYPEGDLNPHKHCCLLDFKSSASTIPPPGHKFLKNLKKGLKKRAGNGTRTRDPDLGKVVLYQLSYSRVHPERRCKYISFFISSKYPAAFLGTLFIYVNLSLSAS
jgi:hypothetical protein